MKKPSHVIAFELREADKELNEKYLKLTDSQKARWAIHSCNSNPIKSLEYIHKLAAENN